MQFLEQLMTSMGQNVKFSVEQVCEGDEFTAGINWHLGKYHLPFPIIFICVSLFNNTLSMNNVTNSRYLLFRDRMERKASSFYQRMQLLRMLIRGGNTTNKVVSNTLPNDNFISKQEHTTNIILNVQESSSCDRVTNQTRRHSAGNQQNKYY